MVSAEADYEGQDAVAQPSLVLEGEDDASQAPPPTEADVSRAPAAESKPEEPEPSGSPSGSRSEDVAAPSPPPAAAEAAESPVLAHPGEVGPSVEPGRAEEASAPEPVVATDAQAQSGSQRESCVSSSACEVLAQQETTSGDQPGELRAAKVASQEEEQSHVEAAASKRSEDRLPPATSVEELTAATAALPAGVEEPAQDEDSPPEHDEEADAELTALQSAESLNAKPPGFMESLTANFAPDTKAMWAQIFGPRYDADDEDGGVQADAQAAASSPRDSVSSKSSLQAKLERGRKLDEQIQASQRRYRERVMRAAAASNTATRRSQVRASRRPQKQAAMSPFEQAGLSLTQVRFCTEKALDETCRRFRHLHAVALEEAEESVSPPVQGVFVTQWELDQLLRELFDPHEATEAGSSRRTLAAPLGAVQTGSDAFAEGVSLHTQLQASWFVPFGQLPQLRSLVMKVTKRHLNEDKLAIVDRHLQRQLTLLPLSLKLQRLVVQLSHQKLKEPIHVPIRQQLRSPEDLAQELVACLAVKGAATPAEDCENLLLFLPVELVAKTHVCSVVGAQRLVFFRFLIDIIAAERSRLSSRSTESLPPALPQQARSKRKSVAAKGARSSSSTRIPAEDPAPDGAKSVEAEATASLRAAHGSLPSPEEAAGNETSDDGHPFQEADPVGDECEKPASRLQQQLESAITQLRRALPTIDADADLDAEIYALNPAIRATYLAAVACHESVLLMRENNIDVDATMADKLRHFIEALQAIQASDQVLKAPASTALEPAPADAPRFPPPYPESTSTAAAESEDGERSTAQPHFPPPYAMTTPSYWAFSPSIPETKSSIAKLATKSPSNRAADLRSHFMSKESPGVGAYNIQQGERLTFQQTPSYSFGAKDDGTPPDTSLPKGSARSSFRQRMKTSLAFAPPVLQPEDSIESPAGRAHVASQCDGAHVRATASNALLDDFPPQYNEGDANEAPEEKSGDEAAAIVETDMDRALRLQQRLIMDEFVQQVVSNQGSPSYFVPRGTETQSSRQSKPKSKPYWATSEVSPGMERLLQRQRRAPKSRAAAPSFNPVKPRAAKRAANKPVPSPRRQLDNDQHLAWAARISELYQQ